MTVDDLLSSDERVDVHPAQLPPVSGRDERDGSCRQKAHREDPWRWEQPGPLVSQIVRGSEWEVVAALPLNRPPESLDRLAEVEGRVFRDLNAVTGARLVGQDRHFDSIAWCELLSLATPRLVVDWGKVRHDLVLVASDDGGRIRWCRAGRQRSPGPKTPRSASATRAQILPGLAQLPDQVLTPPQRIALSVPCGDDRDVDAPCHLADGLREPLTCRLAAIDTPSQYVPNGGALLVEEVQAVARQPPRTLRVTRLVVDILDPRGQLPDDVVGVVTSSGSVASSVEVMPELLSSGACQRRAKRQRCRRIPVPVGRMRTIRRIPAGRCRPGDDAGMPEPSQIGWPPPASASSAPADDLLAEGAVYAAQALASLTDPNDLSDATKIMFAHAVATVELSATVSGIYDQLKRLAYVAEAPSSKSGPVATTLGPVAKTLSDLAESRADGNQPIGLLASANERLADGMEGQR